MPRQARKRSKIGIYHIMEKGINHQIIFENDKANAKLNDTILQMKIYLK